MKVTRVNTLKASLVISQLHFLDGTEIELPENAIVVVTGPNNAGKSTLLEEINRQFKHYARYSKPALILSHLNKSTIGLASDLIDFLDEGGFYNERDDDYDFPYGKSYKRKTLEASWEKGDLPTTLEDSFSTKLEPKDRLTGDRYRRHTGNTDPTEILWDDEAEEIRISQIFSRAFGIDLILNRTRGAGIFKIGNRNQLPTHKKRLTKAFSKLMSNLPSIDNQGDGMRSFAAIALDILTARKSITIIDEPELFLHPPQIRHLARLICEETPNNAQVILATHSDDFVKGVLNSANERVVVVRLKRTKQGHTVSTIDAEKIAELWHDPLFRTSNALAALFHDVAVLVEGESDARFFQAGLAQLHSEEHLPDIEFFSCNGKGKIRLIASALRKLKVPVVGVVDLDIISNPQEMANLYESMGGDPKIIKDDVLQINRSVAASKNQTSGRQFRSELDIAVENIESGKPVPKITLDNIAEIVRQSSPWTRLKGNGIKGILDAGAVQALNRLIVHCKNVGIILNTEGELEGFCRSISRNNKGEWLTEVLKRSMREDPELSDARNFLRDLVSVCQQATS